jgi:hypothetical protein
MELLAIPCAALNTSFYELDCVLPTIAHLYPVINEPHSLRSLGRLAGSRHALPTAVMKPQQATGLAPLRNRSKLRQSHGQNRSGSHSDLRSPALLATPPPA